MKRGMLAAAAAALCLAAAADDPAERLRDPAQEGRARALFKEVRCVVCQNESIDESNADIAADMRRIVRRQVAAGRDDADIRAYLVKRYGPWILLSPPFSGATALLWLTPLLVVLGGGAFLFLQRTKPNGLDDVLSAEEAAELEAALQPEAATLPPRNEGNTSGR